MTHLAEAATSPVWSGVRRWARGLSGRTLALGIIVFAAAGALVADRLYGKVREQLLRETVRAELTPTATSLTLAVNARMSMLHAVSSFLELNWANPKLTERFDYFAGDLIGETAGVRSIQYVSNDGVIAHSYPLEGNEAAVGKNVLLDPRTMLHEDFARALNSHSVVLSGPLELYQGGSGLVGRLAVHSQRDSVLGVAAVVLDLASILDEVGLSDDGAGRNPELTTALLDERGALISGDSTLAGSPSANPVHARVILLDREWTLLAVQRGGWGPELSERRLPMRLALSALVALVGIMVWGLAGRQEARAEAARLRSEEKYSRLFSLTPDGVILTRMADGTILEVNPGFTTLVGRSRGELIGASTVALKLWPAPDDRTAMITAISATGELNDFAVGVSRPDGAMRDARLSGRIVELDGEACILIIARDVTEHRQLERRLAKSAQLESIGRLAGGIAHDFNNLVTAISGYGHLLRDRLSDQPDALADVEEILRSSIRAAELTAQLLAFARRQVVQPRDVDVNAVILDANRRLQQLVGERITLVTRLSPEPAYVHIDPAQVDQLLTNLIVNARDAMPAGGTITVHASVHEATVDIEVTDTGLGMGPEVLAHLFEPFFTTKPQGQGTGLGLATCHGIMEQAGGRIEVHSTIGTGTTFVMHFPRGADASAAAEPGNEAIPEVSVEQTILIAEDEPQVRRLADRVLSNLGYRVLSAGNGTDALELAALHGETIALLITDMVMPGMGGGELSRRIRDCHPETKILLISGYSEELVAAEHGDVAFLPKPFTPDELKAAVAKVLGG